MESTGTGVVGQYARPFSAQVHMRDEEKVPLQDSLPRSFGKSDYTQSSSELDPHGSETSTSKEIVADSPDRKYPWNSGIFTRFPFLGVLPLLLSMICTGAGIATVVYSNGQLVSEWSGVMQPAVLLAYTSTVANAFIGIAFAYGCAVSFWVQAVEGHMPVTNLHRHWEGASSFWGALSALTRRKAVRISLVSVLVTISSLLRGPLMQRASSTHTREVALTGIADLQVAREIFTSDMEEGAFKRSGGSSNLQTGFSGVLRDYQSKAAMRIPGGEHCNNCSLTLTALGFESWNCSRFEETMPEPKPAKNPYLSESFLNYTNTDIFKIDISTAPRPDDCEGACLGGLLNVTVMRKVSEGGDSKLLTQNCWLLPAVMSYNLTVDKGIATFASENFKDDSVFQKFELDVPSTASGSSHSSVLLSLELVGSALWQARANMSSEPVPDPDYDPDSDESWKWVSLPIVTYSGQAGYMYMQESDQNDPSGPNFDDPMDDIINSYREIGLRMSILEAAVNNQNITSANTTISEAHQKSWISQTVDYVSHQVRVESKANPPALGLAVAISLLGPLATLTLFWGYWHLGRDFSMSPVELANAFLVRGPMLPTSSSSSKIHDAQDHLSSQIQHQDQNQYQDQHQDQHQHQHQYQHQHQAQLATLLANCSSNASAKEITKHCARKRADDRWWATFFRSNNREPKLQYGVLESTGQLGFAVEDEQGVIHARKPREGELL